MKRSFIFGMLAALSGWITYSLTPGCAAALVQEKVGPQASKAILAYCLQPLPIRMATRDEVNKLIAPNKAYIDCVWDSAGPFGGTTGVKP